MSDETEKIGEAAVKTAPSYPPQLSADDARDIVAVLDAYVPRQLERVWIEGGSDGKWSVKAKAHYSTPIGDAMQRMAELATSYGCVLTVGYSIEYCIESRASDEDGEE